MSNEKFYDKTFTVKDAGGLDKDVTYVMFSQERSEKHSPYDGDTPLSFEHVAEDSHKKGYPKAWQAYLDSKNEVKDVENT